jgi:N-acetylmuramoyl-L-alanine amidase
MRGLSLRLAVAVCIAAALLCAAAVGAAESDKPKRAKHVKPHMHERSDDRGPTVFKPWKKPERTPDWHVPPIPNDPCVCAQPGRDVKSCTRWIKAPRYRCVRGTPKKCYKFGPAMAENFCPCVKASNKRECLVYGPPGSKAATQYVSDAPDAPQRPKRARSQPKVVLKPKPTRKPKRKPKRKNKSKPKTKPAPKLKLIPTPNAKPQPKPKTAKAAPKPKLAASSLSKAPTPISGAGTVAVAAGGAVAPTELDIDVMTRTMWGESRGELAEGQRAVAWVIINRARDVKNRFPKTIAAVCQQPLQFSTWNPKDPNRQKLLKLSKTDKLYQELRAIAEAALSGRLTDNTDGAQFYFASSIKPPVWSTKMKCARKIGNHIFCRG